MRRRVIGILALTMLTGFTDAGHAEEAFIVRVLPRGHDIAISGPITDGLGTTFRAALAQAPNARLVRLESGGGTLAAAIDLYAAIRAHGLDTVVQGRCESACTIAFLGGVRRFAAPRARLGFHAATGEARDEFPLADYIVRGLYVQSGMAEWFADRIMATPHTSMWHPSLEEMRKAGVISDIGVPD